MAAASAAMAPGAWVGEAAVRAAEPPEPVVPGGRVSAGSAGARMQELMGLRSELMEDRRVLRNIGGNLNDIARVANTDGVLESTVGQVVAMVARLVERVDRTVAEVDRQVNGAAAQLRRSGSRR
ncbi:hypothetical protein Ae406Ps2_6233 [Pseudonocardia sp. Ae406_Ps2]|nr:hypothetical protein Ae406Ps2_6233 [Pseudonocardia sp. Ae406_Ps2]